MSRRKKIVAALLATTVIGITAAGCAETPEASSASDEPVAVETDAPAEEETAEEKPEKAEEPVAEEAEEAPEYTTAQENAIASAENYLDFSAFSRKGLIEQLKFEGYSIKDATYAVDAVSPNWNEQAAKAAKDYLDYSSFSRSGLIDQLEFEGYTTKQATYGVNQTGL
jgi:hypothetical protein